MTKTSLCPEWPFSQVLYSDFLTVLISSSQTASKQNKHKEGIHTERKTPEQSSSFLGEHLKQLKPWSNHSFHLLRGPSAS